MAILNICNCGHADTEHKLKKGSLTFRCDICTCRKYVKYKDPKLIVKEIELYLGSKELDCEQSTRLKLNEKKKGCK